MVLKTGFPVVSADGASPGAAGVRIASYSLNNSSSPAFRGALAARPAI
jgi:hypothetical protein